MKMMRRVVISLVMILLSASLIHGQDLSKYRNFSFGMSLAELSKQIDSQPLHTKLIHKRPAVIQELTWWPRDSSDSSLQADSLRQIFFSFYNGELCKILVTYDRHATQGLTAEDMIQAISAKYGTATRPDAQISFPTNELYRSTEKVIARWEDSQYSINLFRSSLLNSFGLGRGCDFRICEAGGARGSAERNRAPEERSRQPGSGATEEQEHFSPLMSS